MKGLVFRIVEGHSEGHCEGWHLEMFPHFFLVLLYLASGALKGKTLNRIKMCPGV